MKTTGARKCALSSFVLALILILPSWGAAQASFDRIVVFGTSLSDPGNAFALTGQQSTPPYSALIPSLVPSAPYAKGGHHFSNGATWVEQLARPLGLAGTTKPAFQGPDTKATNYAVGGARARQGTDSFDLSMQVSAFLSAHRGVAPAHALYVVEMGGNDLRDALVAPSDATAILGGALQSIAANMGELYAHGARNFLVWNAPDISLAPAVQAFGPAAVAGAHLLVLSFNAGLDSVLASVGTLPGVEIHVFDSFGELHKVASDPAAFGLSVVDAACIMPDIPPFECHVPDDYLFWDGIHPTAAVHAILAHDAAALLNVR